MSPINPFTYVVVQNIEAQRNGAVEKERQLRKEAIQEKDIAAQDDALEHQVESTEEIQAVGEDGEHEEQRRKRKGHATEHGENDDEDQGSHLDLKA